MSSIVFGYVENFQKNNLVICRADNFQNATQRAIINENF